jgi:hypothetical protein
MPLVDPCLIRAARPSGDLVVRLGVPLLHDYLEFVAARAQPNTVLATACDLKVFFTVVGKPVKRVRPADVMAFLSAQRCGGDGTVPHLVEVAGGFVGADGTPAAVECVAAVLLSAGPWQRRGESGSAGSADPAGTSAPASGCAVRAYPADAAAGTGTGGGRRAARRAADAPGPGDGGRDGARRAAPL